MRTLALLSLLLLSVPQIQGQDEKVFKNHIRFDGLYLFQSLLGKSVEVNNPYNSTFLEYQRDLKKVSVFIGVGGIVYDMFRDNDEGSTYESDYQLGIATEVGLKMKLSEAGKFTSYALMSGFFSVYYLEYRNEGNNSSSPSIGGLMVGTGPAIELSYRITDNFSIATQSSLYFTWQINGSYNEYYEYNYKKLIFYPPINLIFDIKF